MSTKQKLYQKPRPGDPVYVVCPCQPDGVPYLIVAIEHKLHPTIVKLVCQECETEFDVTNGRIKL